MTREEKALHLIQYANREWKATFDYEDEIEEETEKILNGTTLHYYIEYLTEDLNNENNDNKTEITKTLNIALSLN